MIIPNERMVRMNKKAFSILLASVVSLSTLTGCGQSQAAINISEAVNNNADICLTTQYTQPRIEKSCIGNNNLSVLFNGYNVDTEKLGLYVDNVPYESASDESEEVDKGVEHAYMLEPYKWVELDRLEDFTAFRKVVDPEMGNFKFGVGSKNGPIFVDSEGNWTGNSTLKLAFSNKEFIKNYWSKSSFKSDFEDAFSKDAEVKYVDGTPTDVLLRASMAAYFNIFANVKTESGQYDIIGNMQSELSRAEAMAALYRCDTPVIFLEKNEHYDELFGYNENNDYASQIEDCSFLKTDNGGLNPYTYYSPITMAEMVYMIVQRYYPEDFENTVAEPGYFNDCECAGDIFDKYGMDKGHGYQVCELEYSLQNGMLTDDLYRAMIVALGHGIISRDTYWNTTVQCNDFMRLILRTYENMYTDNTFPVNAISGKNGASQNVTTDTDETEVIELGDVERGEIVEAESIDVVMDKYSKDIDMTDEQIEAVKNDLQGYTFEECDKKMRVDYCEYLNVRSGPSVKFTILKSIPKGSEVHVIARCVETGWYRIISNGVVAYQCDAYLVDVN